jgi:glycosyltransferase involved in cell wall biosynthesis/aminoglycoside phosphotransferase (APT) family kinase protein
VARSIFFYTDSRVLGGAENAMFMLLGSLDRGAWEPTLLFEDAPEVEPLAERAAGLGVPVRRIPAMPLGPSGARRVPGLVRLLRRERPDVFHAHMSSPVACKWGLTAAVLARVPAVVGTVQVGAYEPPNRSAYLQLRALARGVDRYLAVSREIAAELVEWLDWPAEKVEVVYNAVDIERVAVSAPPGLRAQLGGSETRQLVLTPARLNAQKGHDTLLEATAEVPDALFLLAGDGPERGRLEARAAELGVAERVHFLGRREDVPQLLAACDVFALPSLYEGSSLAVLEAMAAGIPVVSSAIGGTEELIEDGRSGLLVPPDDAAALAAALRRLLGDPQLREDFAARARERVDAGLTREQNAERVEAIYGELPAQRRGFENLPESRRNPLLRREDWRFLLPGAELIAHRRLPRPGGARRARRRAEAVGYTDVRVYWAGPLPHRLPQFWLPVESQEATGHLLASRAPRSISGVLLRRVWSAVMRAGLLAPIYVVARRPERIADDELSLSSSCSLLLLTTGHRSINKAVGLAFEPGEAVPAKAVKFARVAEAEPGLEREAAVLRQLHEERPDLAGVPRLLGTGSRNGRLAVVQEAVAGESLLDALRPENFEETAMGLTKVLIDLAGEVGRILEPAKNLPGGGKSPAREALDWFAGNFGPVVDSSLLDRAGALLADLDHQPTVVEHRDCSPWNVLLTPSGDPVLLDWESAEPAGLPGLDLVYFLANCAFVLDGALESGRTRETYAQLLDPATPHGRVAAVAIAEYTAALGISAEDFRRLRLLTWILHSRSDYRHLELESRGTPSVEALRGSVFLGLVEEELRRG